MRCITVSSNCSLGLTYQVMRIVMLKGSGLADIQYQIYALLAFAGILRWLCNFKL